MHYHNITKDDMLNGDGLRVVLWVAGCDHCCKECHNPVTWDPNGGLFFDEKAKAEIFEELEKDYTIVFKKDKVKIGEQDYNYTVDGPKSKDDFTYYSLKVKDQGKETSYTVFFPTKSKEVALFLQIGRASCRERV